jgi:uncharacterized integral membrane protein
MRFLKIIFASLLAVLGIIFIVENRTVLEQTIQLRLDLYFKSFSTASIPLWVLVLFTFFLGVFTASLYGTYEIIKLRQTNRQLRQRLETSGQEVRRPAEPNPAPAAPFEAPPRSE